MPAAATMLAKILFSPVWLLWRFYGILWWAFNEESTPVPPAVAPERSVPDAATPDATPSMSIGPRTQRVAQDAAFEIIDTSPVDTQTKPIGALKGGFTISLVAAGLLMFAFAYAARHGVIRPSTQLPLWLWSSSMVFVGSLWPIRHIARRQQAAQPQGVKAHTLCIAGGVKDCGVSAFTTAKQVKNTTFAAGRRVHSAASTVTDGAKRLWGRMPRRTA